MKLLNTILTTSLFALTFAFNVSACEQEQEIKKAVHLIQPNKISFIMKDELEKSMKETLKDSMKEIEITNSEYFRETLAKSLSTQLRNKSSMDLLVNNKTKRKSNAE
jgi:hypothetical protein